jgi:hypothetical protein
MLIMSWPVLLAEASVALLTVLFIFRAKIWESSRDWFMVDRDLARAHPQAYARNLLFAAWKRELKNVGTFYGHQEILGLATDGESPDHFDLWKIGLNPEEAYRAILEDQNYK